MCVCVCVCVCVCHFVLFVVLCVFLVCLGVFCVVFRFDLISFMVHRSTKSRLSDRGVVGLRRECRAFSCEIATRVLMKAPTKFSIVRNLLCLDPRQMAVVQSCAKCCRHLSIARNWLQRNVMTFCGSPQIGSRHWTRSVKATASMSSWKRSSTAMWKTVKMLLLLSHG